MRPPYNINTGYGYTVYFIRYDAKITRICKDWFMPDLFVYKIMLKTGQLVERFPVRLWSGGSEVQISGWSNRTQSCQRFATAATFVLKKLSCPGAMTRRWAPHTRYTLRRITAR